MCGLAEVPGSHHVDLSEQIRLGRFDNTSVMHDVIYVRHDRRQRCCVGHVTVPVFEVHSAQQVKIGAATNRRHDAESFVEEKPAQAGADESVGAG
jgi:hypothetical protein